MLTQRYEVAQPHVDALLAWVANREIAIPEIQRPAVWQATGVRSLMGSLMRGFPVGYLSACRKPDVKLKDGLRSLGKRILIALHPGERRFEVSNPAIERGPAWVPQIAAPSGKKGGMA